MINVRRKCRGVLKLSFNGYHLSQDVINPKRCRYIRDNQGTLEVQVHQDMERLQGNHPHHCHLCYCYLFEAWLNHYFSLFTAKIGYEGNSILDPPSRGFSLRSKLQQKCRILSGDGQAPNWGTKWPCVVHRPRKSTGILTDGKKYRQ